MAIFGANEIIVLLGAGASVEAGIPDSGSMIDEIDKLVSEQAEWNRYRDLYRYIRSSIFFADGLDGVFGDDVPFNIERLANVLDELQKKERHALYPFVAAWHPKLQELAGVDFKIIGDFLNAIIKVLRNEWVALGETERADYYKGLLRFQKEYEYPLRIFSLNYDLCVEQACGRESVQRGFSDRTWDWRVFDEVSDDPMPLMLYKLHGSIDWRRFDDGRVQYLDSTSSIRDEEVALIFGTSYKLQYIDPFLFLAYELRRWTLDAAKAIICIGYGFSDEHINGILRQALQQNPERKLLTVIGPGDESDARERIVSQLDVPGSQVIARACGAKEFLENRLTIDALAELFPEEDDLFPEAPDTSGSGASRYG